MKRAFLEKASLFMIAAALLAALPALLVSPGLSAEGDALDYRIPLIRWMIRHASYPSWPWAFVDDYPMLGELLILPFLAIKTELARLPPILGYAACGLFTALIGRELLPERSANRRSQFFLVAFACTLGFQPLLVQSNLIMVDNIATAFTLASLWLLLRGKTKAAGLAMAAALATRYTVWGALPGGIIALLLLHRKGPQPGKKALVFASLALLGALPFLARNTILNSNPFFPLLTGVFNGAPLSTFNGWGRGTDLLSLLLFPFDLLYTNTFSLALFDTRSSPHHPFTYKLGAPFYLQLCTMLVISSTMLRRSREGASQAIASPQVQAILAFALCQFLFWFFGSQQLRFLGAPLALAGLLVLRFLFAVAPPPVLAFLVLLPLYNIAQVQAESWQIAFGKKEPFRESGYVQSAFRCHEHAGVEASAVVGFSSRDVTNGFFSNDFVFLPPNNLALSLPGFPPPPAPDYIYSGLDLSPREGYRPWPRQKPCLLKRN